jgi:hypothetical protein
MAPWLRTTLRLTAVVAPACAASVLGLVAFRALVSHEELRAAVGELGNYLQTVGSVYAVLLAFVVYAVWNQFNEARSYVEREAAALVDLHRTAAGLPHDARAAIHAGLLDYVDAVLRDEWLAMARYDEAAIDRVGHKLDDVWLALHRCKPADDCQHTVYSEALTRFNDLTDLRTNRLVAAQFRIPLTMRILLYAGALIVCGSVYLLAIPQLWLHAFVTAALAGAVAHILYLVEDLDDAFSGDWKVSKRAFERARARFERTTVLVTR